MIQANIGVPTPVQLQLPDGIAGRYPRANIRSLAGQVVATISLNHQGDGSYVASWTPAASGYYTASIKTYLDPSFLVEDLRYPVVSDQYRVGDEAAEQTDLVDQIWDEVLASHDVDGSAATILRDVQTKVQASAIAQAVWAQPLGSYQIGTAGYVLFNISPEKIVDAVWDEDVRNHSLPFSFGLYVDVIRQFVADNNDELLDGVHGLQALLGAVEQQGQLTRTDVDQTNVNVLAVVPAINAARDQVNQNVDQNQLLIESVATQLAGVDSHLDGDILLNRNKLDQLTGLVGTIQNNTTARFIVPAELVRPDSGTKQYQFFLNLYDETGHPEAPDSAPLIRVRDITAAVDLAAGPMTQDSTKTGVYFFNYSVASGSALHPLLIEATIVEGGVTRYLPAVTEVIEFSSELALIDSKVTALTAISTDTQSRVNDPTFGLQAIRNAETITNSSVLQTQTILNLVKAKTDTLPTAPASQADCQAVTAAVLTRPDINAIITQLNLLRDQIRGANNRTNTDVYDRFDISSLVATNDPRLGNLDAPISSRSSLTAPQVWNYATRTLTSLTLPHEFAAGVWNYLLSQITTPNSIGMLVKQMLDAPTSSRASAAQMQSLLQGVAQESTLSAGIGQLADELVQNEISVNSLLTLLNLVKAKTDQIPADPAHEASAILRDNSTDALITNLQLIVQAIRSKTDALPADPAHEATIQAIGAGLLHANDPRLDNLDAKISSRSTLQPSALAPLATTAQLNAVQQTIGTELEQQYIKLGTIEVEIGGIPTDAEMNVKLSPLATATQLEEAKIEIIAAIPAGSGGGTTPAQIWNYATRTLTASPTDTSGLATKQDVAGLAKIQYVNRMATTFREATNDQELVCWSERDGQRVISAADCTVTVKDSGGIVKWTASTSTPNVDGIFRFVNPIVVSADQNYYVVISLTVDGQARSNQQSFFTVG